VKLIIDRRMVLIILLVIAFLISRLVFVLLLAGIPAMLLFKFTRKYASKKEEEVGYFLLFYPAIAWIAFLFIFVNIYIFYGIFIPLAILSVLKGELPCIEKRTWKYFIILGIITFLLTSHNFYNRAEDQNGIKYTGLTTAYIDDAYFSSLINRFIITQNYDSPNYPYPKNNYYTSLIFDYMAGFFTIYGNVPLYVVAQFLAPLIYFSCLVLLFYFFQLFFSPRGALLGTIISLSTVFSLSFIGYAAPWEIANISGAITPFSYELTMFKPQALALAFLVLASFFFVKIIREPEKFFNYAAFGFVYGTIINTHSMTMLLLGIFFFLAFLVLFSRNLLMKNRVKIIMRNYLLLASIALIVGARYLYISLFQVKSVGIRVELFWFFNYIKWDVGKFLFTFGHVLPLVIIGIISLFYIIKEGSEEFSFELKRKTDRVSMDVKIMLLLLILSFVVPNILTYRSWHFDRSLMYAQFIYAFFAVVGLKFLLDFDKFNRYIFAGLLILIAFIYLHNAYVFNQTLIPKYYNDQPVFYYFYKPELEAMEWIKKNTDVNAVFVNNGWHLWRRPSPIIGIIIRKTIKGYEHDDVGNIFSDNYTDEVLRTLAVIRIYNQSANADKLMKLWGYDDVSDVILGKRQSTSNLTIDDINAVLNARIEDLLEKYNVSYIYYGIEEHSMYGEIQYPQFELVYNTQYVDIWKVR